MHGYTDGRPRIKDATPALEHKDGDDMRYTDGWITREALKRMSALAEEGEPFFLAVGIMKPHLPFACPQSYHDLYAEVNLPDTPHPEKPSDLSTWHRCGEFFDQYAHNGRDPREDQSYADELRRSYAACVSFADAQVAQLLAQLEKTGLARNTIVVLWGDHGYHLGEHAIWGKHALFEESLHAPLVVHTPDMTKPGAQTDAIVESIDIYPTLCALAGIKMPLNIDGQSLAPLLHDPSQKGSSAITYYEKNETVRTDRYRLIRHGSKKGNPAFELYDHQRGDGENTNIAAENPQIIKDLDALIEAALE
jgi:iduronate 2-sulfatase